MSVPKNEKPGQTEGVPSSIVSAKLFATPVVDDTGLGQDVDSCAELMATVRGVLAEAALFFGREIINGIEIIVTWYDVLGGGQYEIYLPQKEETIVIGEDRDQAKAVFEYAKKMANSASDVDALFERIQMFIRNGFQEAAPPKPRAAPAVVAPLLAPTRLEIEVNGIKIVLASTGGDTSDYYIMIPDVDMRALRNRMNPGNGRLYINPPRNPSDALARAKELAASAKSPEDLYYSIWNVLR